MTSSIRAGEYHGWPRSSRLRARVVPSGPMAELDELTAAGEDARRDAAQGQVAHRRGSSASAGWRPCTRPRTATRSASPSRCSTRSSRCDPQRPRALPARGLRRQHGRPPGRRRGPRRRRDRGRRRLPGDGAARRRDARGSPRAQRRRAARGARCSRSPTSCSTCSPPRTPRASSTATSSPRTSSSRATGASRCSTSASRACARGRRTRRRRHARGLADGDARRSWPPSRRAARWDEVDGQTDLWAVGATHVHAPHRPARARGRDRPTRSSRSP